MQKYLNILSKTKINNLLKLILLLAMVVYIFNKISYFNHTSNIVVYVSKLFKNPLIPIIIIVLMVLNWSLEALKWKIAVEKVEEITFLDAFKGVLSGLTIALFLPQSLGDYAGRIGQLHNTNRTDALISVFLCHFTQFTITCSLGCFAVIYFWINDITIPIFSYLQFPEKYFIIFVGSIFIGSLVITILFPRIISYAFTKLVFMKMYLHKYFHYFKVIINLDINVLSYIVFLSFIRYLCFLCQYLIILYSIGFKCDKFIASFGVCLIFLLKSIIPSFNFLSDLGIREFSALMVFDSQTCQNSELIVVTSSLILWCFNIFVPSILGILTFRTLEFTRNDADKS